MDGERRGGLLCIKLVLRFIEKSLFELGELVGPLWRATWAPNVSTVSNKEINGSLVVSLAYQR